jgi:hypothetical protein
MNSFSKLIKGIGLVAVVVALGLFVGWLGTRGSSRGTSVPPTTVVDSAPAPKTTAQNSQHPRPIAQPVTPAAGTETVAAADASSTIDTNWEEHLEEILPSDKPESEKAKQLLDLYTRLPEDAKGEVAQHISNLVADEDYAPLGKLLSDPQQPEDAMNVFYGDLLNRPNHIKLPELLDVAQVENHPKSADAVELLKLFLDEDYGQDWTAWRTKMDEWLKANPD